MTVHIYLLQRYIAGLAVGARRMTNAAAEERIGNEIVRLPKKVINIFIVVTDLLFFFAIRRVRLTGIFRFFFSCKLAFYS